MNDRQKKQKRFYLKDKNMVETKKKKKKINGEKIKNQIYL